MNNNRCFYKRKLGATKVIVMYRSQFSYGTSEFSNRDGPEREHVGDGSVGATDISKFRCSGPRGSKGSARLAPVWCWSRLAMSAYPSAECKSVNINPCDSRVWECLLSCVAPRLFK